MTRGSLKKILRLKILIPVCCFFILMIPLGSFLLSKATSTRYPNWSAIFENVAFHSSFGLFKVKNEEDNALPGESKEERRVSSDQIEIVNKRINIENTSDNLIVFSALLKNRSEYRLPPLSIKSIKIYDIHSRLIGEKTDFQSVAPIILTANGEAPFSFQLDNSEDGFSPASFEIEIEEQSFFINPEIIELNISNMTISMKAERNSPENSPYKFVSYTYKFTVENNTKYVVDNIHYIGFMKYGDNILTREASACCTQLYFTIPQELTNLNEPEKVTFLDPGEKRDVEITLSPDELLFVNGMDESLIVPVFYVWGYADN